MRCGNRGRCGAVQLEPTFSTAWLALCIELYRADHRADHIDESIVCSEHIPLNEMFDEYKSTTLQRVVLVGGVADCEIDGIVRPVLLQGPSAMRPIGVDDLRPQLSAIEHDQMARREAKEIARIYSLEEQRHALKDAAQSIPKRGTWADGCATNWHSGV